MLLRQKIQTLYQKMRRVPMKYYFVGAVLCVAGFYLVAFRQQTLAYNYGGDTCGERLIVLPGLFSQSGSDKYRITTQGGWSVAGQQLTATSLCVSPVAAPAENSSEKLAYAPWGGWLARFAVVVEANQHPTVDMAVLEEPIPANRTLALPISEPDTTFSYTLEANDKQTLCESTGQELTCGVPDLGLRQGDTYPAVLEKSFRDTVVEAVANTELETLSPVSIIESSIKNGAVVYHKPQSVTLKTDKPIKQADIAVRRIDDNKSEVLPSTTESDGQEVTVRFSEHLPRQATIELEMNSFEATDGSTLLDKKIMTFKTSGGPRVESVNVGSSGVAPGAQIIVTFDQALASDQKIGPLITTTGGVAYQARKGNQLIFSTDEAKRCADISIALKADIASEHGIAGQSAWKYSGRIRCYTITTIGYSSQGRAINAYHFGASGPSVMYTGAIHGSEASTKYLMDRWIQELDANPSKIPGGKRVIVVPMINPDGFAAGTRLNARGIDLNRNFATSDWKKDIQHTDGSAFRGGGGGKPMSEPETRVIADFVAQQRPELVISYHSIGGLVISNQSGQANVRASQYANLSGYRLSGGDSGEFGYQITGTADDYYREKLGVPSILIELGSHSYHQFEYNQAAMWAMMR